MPDQPDTRQTLRAGDEIGGARVQRLLGRGGMGEVYYAEDIVLARAVAIKTMRADLTGTEGIDRFMREARLASRIDHPNVVTIYQAGVEKEVHFIVMQFINGQNLSELVKHHKSPLHWQTALKIIRMAARGLRAVHKQGLLHRDVKPSNIMLSQNSRVVLMDFGLVRGADSELTNTGDVVGTPAFMSPEQCRCESLDERSDVYSLGATLYALVAGRAPFEGSALEVVQRVARGRRPGSIVRSDIPETVTTLIDKAMQPRRHRRHQSVPELIKALDGEIEADPGSLGEPSETSNISSLLIDTPLNPKTDDLVPLSPARQSEIMPVDLTVRRRFAALIVAAIFLVLVLILIIMPTNSTPVPDGMVRIEAGDVWLGIDVTRHHSLWSLHSEQKHFRDLLQSISKDKQPHRVSVNEFLIDKYEVTNAQYKKFLDATGHAPPEPWENGTVPAGKEDHPVVFVKYSDAEAYAKWAGKSLPTGAQWRRAFGGDSDKLFPWGNTYDASRCTVNDNRDAPFSTTPVRATPDDVSRFGVCNLVGNAREYIRGQTVRQGSVARMAKGASFDDVGFIFGTGAVNMYIFGEDTTGKAYGFRCVIDESSP